MREGCVRQAHGAQWGKVVGNLMDALWKDVNEVNYHMHYAWILVDFVMVKVVFLLEFVPF